MTGTVLRLPSATDSGIIRSEDGSETAFTASAIVAGSDALTIGCRVRFDFDRSWSNITSVRLLPVVHHTDDAFELRYVGFEQIRNVRCYQFDVVAGGQTTRRLAVTADLALFLKHQVNMQEGPGLCSRKLNALLEACPETGSCELENEDVAAYASAKAAVAKRTTRSRAFSSRRKHGPAPPTPWHRPSGSL